MTDLVFLHGLGQTAASWDEVLAAMGGPDALCPDLFDFPMETVTYPRLYQALCAFLDRLPGKFSLCGLSLGGVLALHYAVEHPERLTALVLIGAQYVMPKGLLAFQNAVFRLMPARAFAGVGISKADMIRLSASMSSLDFRGQMGKITCPVLVACGEKDRANRKAAAQLEKLLPNARFALIPGAEHEVNTLAPQALGKILKEFLDGNAR